MFLVTLHCFTFKLQSYSFIPKQPYTFFAKFGIMTKKLVPNKNPSSIEEGFRFVLLVIDSDRPDACFLRTELLYMLEVLPSRTSHVGLLRPHRNTECNGFVIPESMFLKDGDAIGYNDLRKIGARLKRRFRLQCL